MEILAFPENITQIIDVEQRMGTCFKELYACYRFAYIPAILICLDLSLESLCNSISTIQTLKHLLQQPHEQFSVSSRVSPESATREGWIEKKRKLAHTDDIPENIGNSMSKEREFLSAHKL